LYPFSGATPTVLLANSTKVYKSTGGNFTTLQYSSGNDVVSASPHGACMAKWADSMYIATGIAGNGGYVWNVNADGSIKFKPSFLVKYEPTSPVSFDLNAHFLFNDKLWLGTSYRYNAAVVFMAEYQITEQFRAGFAFDATTSDIRQYQNGTIEFMLGYDFTQKLVKIKHPRYF
jgi:hypothetical protein